MTKRIPVERYYAMLDKIDRSEKTLEEKAPAFMISAKHNLNIAYLSRQRRLRGARNRSDR